MELYVADDEIGRYFRRIQLGLRFLTHGARPQTICQWTSLTPDQLTTLRQRWGFRSDDNPRGPSPESFSRFFSSWTRRHQWALFLSICRMVRAISPRCGPQAAKDLPSIENGERLCEAFEIFKEWEPSANFDFEESELLLTGLVAGEKIELSRCADCSSALLIDKTSTKKNECLRCRRTKAQRRPLRKKRSSLQQQCDQAMVEK
jgi:hypothetical protein